MAETKKKQAMLMLKNNKENQTITLEPEQCVEQTVDQQDNFEEVDTKSKSKRNALESRLLKIGTILYKNIKTNRFGMLTAFINMIITGAAFVFFYWCDENFNLRFYFANPETNYSVFGISKYIAVALSCLSLIYFIKLLSVNIKIKKNN